MAITFENIRSGLKYDFDNLQLFKEWRSREMTFFQTIGGGQSYPSIQRNTVFLSKIQGLSDTKDGTIDDLEDILARLADHYVPADRYLEIFTRQISDQTTKALLCSELISPGSTGRANPQSSQWEAIVLSKVFQTYGTMENVQNELVETHNSLTELNRGQKQSLHEWTEFLSRSKREWNEFHVQAALQAPKHYWDEKARLHQKKVPLSRNIWFSSILINLLIIVVSLWLSSRKAILSENDIYATIERFVYFGSFLGFGIWWSRQSLKNYRLNEHLAEDAKERVTMIETFAALKGQGLGGEDFGTILTALFRPAVTGLVEDSGPSMPIEILIKSLGEAALKKSS